MALKNAFETIGLKFQVFVQATKVCKKWCKKKDCEIPKKRRKAQKREYSLKHKTKLQSI